MSANDMKDTSVNLVKELVKISDRVEEISRVLGRNVYISAMSKNAHHINTMVGIDGDGYKRVLSTWKSDEWPDRVYWDSHCRSIDINNFDLFEEGATE